MSSIPPATGSAPAPLSTPASHGTLARLFAWRRVKVTLITCAIFFILLVGSWEAPKWMLVTRILIIGTSMLLAFGILEKWPRNLPPWLARWALQVLGVAAITPIAAFAAYTVTLMPLWPWWTTEKRMTGWFSMTMFGLLVGPWITVAALFRQIKDEARNQALSFELEKSELERNALDARMRLLQAQVEPHFLFNTLANIRELVIAGSPRAPQVLDSLIAYLRAAVPRLKDPAATLGQELDLVRAYLEVMHMRMPDRLKFSLDADDCARNLAFPPMALLTLVENAMRHGIDPSEEGGTIDIHACCTKDNRCRVQVRDSGRGLPAGATAEGTGLPNLRERLQLAFAGDASLRLVPITPHGVSAELDFPARKVAP
ncbi:MAG: histidine kinase [Betaproteobacteria bacterium]|nr:histidine kinase [Betaproteobacteria bacterium]